MVWFVKGMLDNPMTDNEQMHMIVSQPTINDLMFDLHTRHM